MFFIMPNQFQQFFSTRFFRLAFPKWILHLFNPIYFQFSEHILQISSQYAEYTLAIINKFFYFTILISIFFQAGEGLKNIIFFLLSFIFCIILLFLNATYTIYYRYLTCPNNKFFLLITILFFTFHDTESHNHGLIFNPYSSFCYIFWINYFDIRAFLFSFITIISVIDTNLNVDSLLKIIFYNLFLPYFFHKILNQIIKKKNNEIEKVKESYINEIQKQKLIFASMTHDLRNPISSQINTLEDLSESNNLSKKEKRGLEIASYTAKFQLNLVNNILDFSKIENGNFEINEIPINIKELINQIISIEKKLANKKGIYLKTKMISYPPESVIGDPNRISQIMMNLIGNSIKFTTIGGVLIKIKWIKNLRDLNNPIILEEPNIIRKESLHLYPSFFSTFGSPS